MSVDSLGALARLWSTGEPEHLPLLGLQPPEADRVIRRLRDIGADAPGLGEDVQVALMDEDWRPQLVGAVCVALGLGEPKNVDTLWSAALLGSWVTPQLLAAASLVDGKFRNRARKAIDLIVGARDGAAWPAVLASARLAREARRNVSGPDQIRGKALATLLALLDPAEPWVRTWSYDPRVQALLKADVDDGGWIARRWRDRIAGYR